MGRTFFKKALFGAVVFTSVSLVFLRGANSFTPTITPSGIPVRWQGNLKLNLAGNPQNQSGIDTGTFYSAMVRSLQRWEAVSGSVLKFDYWQGTDPGIFETNSDYNGLSTIYFASNGGQAPHLSGNVLGLTQVWYDTSNGRILEADIVLNDRDFRFTNDARDTSGFGSGSIGASSSKANVYIENVITHELGHAYGLSHSGGLQSTMLFMESPEQAHLGCDEAVGVHALYPGSDASSRGSISGSVVSDRGPVFGAHVLAISQKRGTVLATTLTDPGGHYKLGALEPGTYFLLVEPFYAGAATLPTYYSSVRTDICSGGRSYSRTLFMEDNSYRLKPIEVGLGGHTTQVPPIQVSCSNSTGMALTGFSGSSSRITAPVIYDGGNGIGAVDRFRSSNTTYYRLKAPVGRLEIHAISYSLYSPIHPIISLIDSSGNPVPAQISEQVYQGDSGYVNYDSALVVDGLSGEDLSLKVSAAPLDTSLYPAGPISLDSVPFLVITGSLNEGAPSLASSLPVNARCRMDENFPSYSSPGGFPPHRTSEEDEEDDGIGFCGTLDFRSGGTGSGPDLGAIIGWLLPWLAMGAGVHYRKRWQWAR